MAPWLRPLTTFETTITRWRGSRSAQMPPTSRKSTCGRERAARTKPRSAFEPVRSRTANASATLANALPMNDVVRPRNRNRKLRSRSGPSWRRSIIGEILADGSDAVQEMEPRGIEPLTSRVPLWRSPS